MRLALGLGLGITHGSDMGAAGAAVSMVMTNRQILESAGVGATVGTVSITGTYSGTPTWSLVDDAGGKFAINSSSGVVTVAGALSEGLDTITVRATGTSPAPDDTDFVIRTVFQPSLDFSDPRNTQYLGPGFP